MTKQVNELFPGEDKITQLIRRCFDFEPAKRITSHDLRVELEALSLNSSVIELCTTSGEMVLAVAPVQLGDTP